MAYASLRHLTIHLLVHEQRPARRLAVERARREGGGGDSNPRPPAPQPGALPTELPPPRSAQDSDGPARGTYEDFNVFSRCSACLPSAHSSLIFALNAWMPSGFRLLTSTGSTTTAWSTQLP